MPKTIILPLRYKSNLMARFDTRRAVFRKPDHVVDTEHIAINVPCQLCLDYGSNCEICPFYAFNYDHIACRDFISSLLRTNKLPFMIFIERVFWFPEDNDIAVRAINELVQKASKYIVWK
jgi:hypothetical protein